GARKMPKRRRWLIGVVPPLLWWGLRWPPDPDPSWRFIRGSPTGDWIDRITAPCSKPQGVVICQKSTLVRSMSDLLQTADLRPSASMITPPVRSPFRLRRKSTVRKPSALSVRQPNDFENQPVHGSMGKSKIRDKQ